MSVSCFRVKSDVMPHSFPKWKCLTSSLNGEVSLCVVLGGKGVGG